MPTRLHMEPDYPRASRGRTAVRFPANSSQICCVELALDRQLCTHHGSRGFLRRGFTAFITPQPPFIVCRFVQSHYKNTSKEETNHGTFVSSVHLFKYVVIRNRLNNSREDHPFNFVLSCSSSP